MNFFFLFFFGGFKKSEDFRLNNGSRPFSRPIEPLSESVEELVYFPVDDEANANGLVSLSWLGPHVSQMRELVALDLLLNFLSESSISTLHSHFIDLKSYCNKLSYKVTEYSVSYVNVSFLNAQLSCLDCLKAEFLAIMAELSSGQRSFDLERLQNIARMKCAEIQDKYEDAPHETVSQVCIGDFLYGNASGGEATEFKKRFVHSQVYTELIKETTGFWLSLIDRYMLGEAKCVCVIGRPSEQLMRQASDFR